MRFLRWLVVITLVLSCGYLAKARAADDAAMKSLKVGYVDFNKALNEVNEGKKAKSALQAEFNEKQKKLEKSQNDLKAMQEKLEKDRLLLSEEALKKKEEEYRRKFMELQQMLMTFRQEMAKRETDLTKDILGKLKLIINDIGEKENYAMILEKSQDVVLYSPKTDDLTDRVITLFNKGKYKGLKK